MRNRIAYLMVCATIILCTSVADVFSQASDESTYVTGITSGRARSLIGVVLGIASVIVGWSSKRKTRRRSASALLLGIAAMIVSVAHLLNLTGDFGTGGGKAGAIVALGLGTFGCVVSVVALLKQRKG
jgi:peptidoglycan/LPS O-acetylase OafA/YrhL